MADIDEKTDLAHAISCMRAIKQAGSKYQTDLFVPQRVLDWVDYMGIQVIHARRTTNTTRASTSTRNSR